MSVFIFCKHKKYEGAQYQQNNKEGYCNKPAIEINIKSCC